MADALATLADDQPPAYRRRQHDRPYGVSVNLTHAKVARDPKPPAPRAPAKPRRQEVAPAMDQPSIEIGGRVLARISDYGSLQSAVRARVDEMGLTRLELDHLSGNQEGYSGKVLGPKQVKKFGKHSLGSTLGALGSYLALVDDPEQVTKLKAIADALSALSAAIGLGVTREEFMQIAALRTLPHKHGLGFLGDTLSYAGCKLVLVEDASATAKMMARANKRQRPLRPLKLLPTAAKADQSHART